MTIKQTELRGVLLIEPTVYEDRRGFFFESYSFRLYEEHGITQTFVQDNHSRSECNTVRGLHYQLQPGQSKLVRVVHGEVWDVAVDIRVGSPTYGQHLGRTLSAGNKQQLYIPAGFAHGFCVLSESAEIEYKVTTYYAPEKERGIFYRDPALAIPWPCEDAIMSDRDAGLPSLADAENDFIYIP